MARGWQSKSVEEQQASRAEERPPRVRPTAEQAEQQRRRESLVLSRKRCLDQLQAAQHPNHRRMLEQALAELDARLARLG